jgi:metal-responsive CopG/Arc/MetJ family transcriptional regulator
VYVVCDIGRKIRVEVSNMKTKSIISANIDTELVKKLKHKTKGTRSRTIERAIRAYLDGESDFNLLDVPEDKLIQALIYHLNRESNFEDTPLILLLKERMQ